VLHLNVNSDDQLQGDQSRPSDVVLALSAAQLGIWFAQQIDAASSEYNIGEFVEIRGRVDPFLFERALRQVVERIEALRVRLTLEAEGPRQIIGVLPLWQMPVFDVSGEANPQTAAMSWMQANLAEPFDLFRGPLFGYALMKLSAECYYWCARYHHIIMDGFSMSVIARHVAESYTQICSDHPAFDTEHLSFSALVQDDVTYRESRQFETVSSGLIT
jgi:hypothetical protein